MNEKEIQENQKIPQNVKVSTIKACCQLIAQENKLHTDLPLSGGSSALNSGRLRTKKVIKYIIWKEASFEVTSISAISTYSKNNLRKKIPLGIHKNSNKITKMPTQATT